MFCAIASLLVKKHCREGNWSSGCLSLVGKWNQSKAIPSEIKWSRPIGRILYSSLRCLDSHSSRRWITPTLKLPTRMLSEQRQRMPIWNCSEWRLPRFTLYSLRCKDSSLWPYSSSHDGRSLTVTLLCGVRTFLSLSPLRECQRLPSLLHIAILAESESIAKKGF